MIARTRYRPILFDSALTALTVLTAPWTSAARKRRRSFLWGLVALLLVGTVGCGDDSKDKDLPEPKAHVYGRVLVADRYEALEGILVEAVLDAKDRQVVEATSDAEGRFHLGLPAEGRWVVTATSPDYTFAQRALEVKEGDRAALDPMYMTPLDGQGIQVDEQGGSGENSDGSMAIDVPAGALSHGLEIRLTRFTHGWNLPNALPEASHFTYACDLSPTGQVFDQPVTVRIKNDRGFPPGMPVPVGVYDPDSASWSHESMGTISEDGEWVVFEVSHFSARDANLGRKSPGSRPGSLSNRAAARRARRRNHECSAVHAGSLVGVADGHLTVEHGLPGRRLFGEWFSRSISYDSSLDRDQVWLAASYDITQTGTELPERIRFVAEIAGNRWEYTRKPIEAPMTFGVMWNGQDPMGTPMAAGTYHYKLVISNEYRATFAQVPEFGGEPTEDTGIEADELAEFPTVIEGDIEYQPGPRRETWSWGVGWALAEISQLHETDSEVTITTGDRSLFGFSLQDGAYVPWEGDHSTLERDGDEWVWTQICGCRRRFDGQGRLLSFRDRDGRQTSYSYDGQGRLVSITDPDGGKTTVSRDGEGFVDSVTDSLGRTTSFERDDRGDLVRITNPDGTTRTFSYDEEHHLLSQTDAQGRTTTYTYNRLGSVVRVDRPDGSHTEHGTLLQETSRDATWTPVGYRDGEGGWHEFWPNEYGTRTAIIEPEGRMLILERNEDDQVVRLTWAVAGADPAKVTSYRYDDKGLLLEATGPNAAGEFGQPGNLAIEYDAENRPIRATLMPFGTWRMEYDGEQVRPSVQTLPDNRVLSATHDANGMATEIQLGGMTYSYEYDGQGNVTSATAPSGATWSLTRDAAGRITQITDPEGRVSQVAYDQWGMVSSVSHGPATWNFEYQVGVGQEDPDNSAAPEVLVAVTGPGGATCRFDYDARDRLVSMTDALSNQVVFERDGEGRLVSRTLPECGTTEYVRNRDGQVVEERQSTGRTVTFQYDRDTGRLQSASGPTVTVELQRDAALRVSEEVQHFSDGFDVRLVHQYPDATETIRRVDVLVGDDIWSSSFEYDEDHLLLPAEIFGGSDSWGLVPRYDDVGLMTGWDSWLYQVEAAFAYDADGRLTEARYDQSAGPNAVTLRFSYSASGLLAEMGTPDGTATFAYDEMARIVSVTHPEPMLDDEQFTYDQAGNLRRAGQESEYRYDEAHRLLQDPDFTYTYDAAGNRRTRVSRADSSVTSYDYDAEGRLLSVTLPDGTLVEYRYDPFGRRVERLLDGVITHRYVWALQDVVAEFDGQGRLVHSYPLSLVPDSLRGLSYLDASDSMRDLYFALAPDGTVMATIDEDGNLTETYHYTALGKPVGLAADPLNTRLFAGMDYDPVTGLYYARNRWYDPETGTFLQRDPLPMQWAMFPYVFAGWAPWNGRDPSGLAPGDETAQALQFGWSKAGKPGVKATVKAGIGKIPIVGKGASGAFGNYMQLKDLLDIVRADDPTKKAVEWYKGFSPAGKYLKPFLSLAKDDKPVVKKPRRKRRRSKFFQRSCRASYRILRVFGKI